MAHEEFLPFLPFLRDKKLSAGHNLRDKKTFSGGLICGTDKGNHPVEARKLN
jgi:hypothetical protein